VAARLGCDAASICHWEIGRSYPKVSFLKPIVEFLGYNPFPHGETIAERLVNHRKARGWTQKHFAAVMGIDQATLAKYERGDRIPTGKYHEICHAILQSQQSVFEDATFTGPAL
jgi:transcriptional regulator with XRE-family HTH domain